MDLHESGEMYLETILILKNQNEYVRSIDIAHTMDFSKPSVSRAIKLLKESQLIVVDDKGYIEFLVSIGVSVKQAEEDACRIEHIISDETQQCIQNFLKKQS